MADDDALRAAHEAEQAEMQNEMQTETEYQDWVRGWKRDDLIADLDFNRARTVHTLATVKYLNAKGDLHQSMANLVTLVWVILAVLAVGLGIDYIVGLF